MQVAQDFSKSSSSSSSAKAGTSLEHKAVRLERRRTASKHWRSTAEVKPQQDLAACTSAWLSTGWKPLYKRRATCVCHALTARKSL